MHICFLCNEYPPAPHGGVGSFVQTLGRALVGRGHKVSVVGVYPREFGGESRDGDVCLYRIPRAKIPGSRLPYALLRARQTLSKINERQPIDVLEGAEDAIVLGMGFPKPRILRMHGSHIFFQDAQNLPINWWTAFQERRGFRSATHLCAVGSYVAEKTRQLLRLGDCPITIIPNPVDTAQFAPSNGDLEEPGLLVFVGTMIEKKGVRQLVQAMPKIVSAIPEARLELYGGDTVDPATGGSYEQAVKSEVPAEVAGHIRFCGKVPREDLPTVLARAQVCVYPSHMEAHPIAWLEALAAGKPLVASNIGPGLEIVNDGVDGLLCNPYDPAAIAECVIRVLRDSALRSRLKINARKRAESAYAMDPIVERNLAYYRECVGSPIK